MKSKKQINYAKLDRFLVILCTILVILSCAATVYIVKQERRASVVQSNGVTLETDDDKNTVGITARYVGDICYEGTYASKQSVKVYAKLKDGTRKEITKWDGVLGPVSEGDNTFTITYRDFTTDIAITGTDVDSITTPTDYLMYYYDKAAARRLVTDVKAGKGTYDDVFEGVLFCGDSRTKAIITSLVLESDHVLAENGVGLDHLDMYMQELLRRNPKTIILNYGVNSLSESRQARDEFVEQYKGLLQEIKRALPQSRIIVAAIFPVSPYFILEQPRMEYIDDVNLQLFKMCIDLDIEFIDGTDIIRDNSHLINPDGLHFSEQFYQQYWLEGLVERMGIGMIDFEQ